MSKREKPFVPTPPFNGGNKVFRHCPLLTRDPDRTFRPMWVKEILEGEVDEQRSKVSSREENREHCERNN